ncbi:MAG: D-alanyl-D-alanine carboxypeptidase [Rhodospirillaceae bacterium]|nr:D-alanyl-D-alanine carboxypeptidase [Rhodospirillaceae bacterium]|tara:strand:- start:5790 stop:6992 length:1203 start_codon:yes stop_codon:yes gene_type:complete
MGGRVRLRLIVGLLIAVLLQLSPATAARYASIIVDEKTGTVLHAANPDWQTYPASLTKMMTLYMVFERLKAGKLQFGTSLKVSRRAALRPKSKVGVKRGTTITVRQGIQALVTKSANDVATVVAEGLGGTEEKFARMMTVRARQLGMSRTTFKNASGLPDRGQKSTARDMAKLSIALRRDFPKYFKFFSNKEFYFRGRRHGNHNKLLRRLPGTDGIKTGYIRDSGFNIAVSTKYKGRRLVGVVFGGKSANKRDRHTITLFKRVFRMLDEMDRTDRRNRIAAIANGSRSVSLPGLRPAQRPAKKKKAIRPEDRPHWSVQVGAFDRFTPAHLAASRASRIAPSLRRSRISVKSSATRGKRVYRARLVGLPERKARQACQVLKRRNITCLVIKEESAISEGDR